MIGIHHGGAGHGKTDRSDDFISRRVNTGNAELQLGNGILDSWRNASKMMKRIGGGADILMLLLGAIRATMVT